MMEKLLVADVEMADVLAVILAIIGIVSQLIELVHDIINSIIADKAKNASDPKEDVAEKNDGRKEASSKKKKKKKKKHCKGAKVKVQIKT